jgi:hypothetical protein
MMWEEGVRRRRKFAGEWWGEVREASGADDPDDHIARWCW